MIAVFVCGLESSDLSSKRIIPTNGKRFSAIKRQYRERKKRSSKHKSLSAQRHLSSFFHCHKYNLLVCSALDAWLLRHFIGLYLKCEKWLCNVAMEIWDEKFVNNENPMRWRLLWARVDIKQRASTKNHQSQPTFAWQVIPTSNQPIHRTPRSRYSLTNYERRHTRMRPVEECTAWSLASFKVKCVIENG